MSSVAPASRLLYTCARSKERERERERERRERRERGKGLCDLGTTVVRGKVFAFSEGRERERRKKH